jgi:hypothetical protein
MADIVSASAAVAVSILAMYAGGGFTSKQSRQSGGALIHRSSTDTPVTREFLVTKFSAASIDTYSNPLENDRASLEVLIEALRVAVFLNDQPRIRSISQVIARFVVSNGVLDVWSQMVSVNEGVSFDEIENALTVFSAFPLEPSDYNVVENLLHCAWTEGPLRSSPDIDRRFAADVRFLFEGQLGIVAPALRTIQGTGAFGSEMPLGVSVTADKVPLLLFLRNIHIVIGTCSGTFQAPPVAGHRERPNSLATFPRLATPFAFSCRASRPPRRLAIISLQLDTTLRTIHTQFTHNSR